MNLFNSNNIDNQTWDDLEELLISADVGFETTEKLIESAKKQVTGDIMNQGEMVRSALKGDMVNILKVKPVETYSEPLPVVTMVVGVNGSGKTTSVAKLAFRMKKGGGKVLLVAADTFRAAAIDQLQHWGKKVGVDVVAHQPGADSGAVVFDALQAADSRNVDSLIIDTAGRLHTKFNLMEELKKIQRVAAKRDITAPHEVILVIDATTGQNGLTQAKHFVEAVGVTSIFLVKLDGTAKGGIVLAICNELKIPVKFIGTGEKVEDMEAFDAEAFVEALCS
jgi:fused signal recognition particle receptor